MFDLSCVRGRISRREGMRLADTSDLIGLLSCALAVVAICTVVAVAVSRHVRRQTETEPAPSLPDFEVVDCGDQIHFVPLREHGHVVGTVGTGSCECHPCRTANRRRSGRRVVYVDHRPLRNRHVVGS
jgi:hypothetical protein